ncbi:MAG: beta-1,6-N-acetylglucosaminyltransferase [Paracoccaceae bacterium]
MSGAALGVIILCHENFERVADVVHFWRAANVPVAIHVDARRTKTKVLDQFGTDKGVIFIPRRTCRWGAWDIVGATLDGVDLLLPLVDPSGHILLQSGSCVPLHAAEGIMDHLAQNADVDFIESISLAQSPWVQGGLSRERFSLYHFFAWQERRWAFDASVRFQRAIGLVRNVPKGIRPHLGMQWWCLTHKTLRLIRKDPHKAQRARYFQTVWIPDESYFQTLVRPYARVIKPPLSWSRFDRYGKPYILYDDHAPELAKGAPFIVRKVDAGAQNLYDLMGQVRDHSAQIAAVDDVDRLSRLNPLQRGLARAPYAQRLSHNPYVVIVHDTLPEAVAARAQRPFDRNSVRRQWISYAAHDHLRDVLHPHENVILHMPLEDLQQARSVILQDGYATVLMPHRAADAGGETRRGRVLHRRWLTWRGEVAAPQTRARHAIIAPQDLERYLEDWARLHAWEHSA